MSIHSSGRARSCWSAIAVLAVVWLAAGCSTNTSGVALRTTTEQTAERDYLEALDNLTTGNYPEAVSGFQAVSKAPRYVKWSVLAQLRIGDALFYQSKFAESAQQFLSFVSQNEGDPNVPYASYMMARAFYEQIPDDWFLTPPAFENDRQPLQRARQELRSFIQRFPRSRFLGHAREMLAEAESMEYGFNAYAAEYYETKSKPAGVAVRLKNLMETWKDVGRTLRNYRRIGRAYSDLGCFSEAVDAYRKALTQYPQGEHVSTMTRTIGELQAQLDAEPLEPDLDKRCRSLRLRF